MIPNAITSSATLQSPQSQSMAEFSSKEEREDSLSLIIGIASLVLEGRPIGDEYETLPPSKRDEKHVQQAKYEKYGNIFSELTSPSLPCTSRVQVAKSSMSTALNKTAQKLYQLRQAENGVGRKGCGASVNHQYTMQSIPNNFHEENECADRTKNINDDYSGFFYTLQSLANSCLQSGQSATNTSLGQTVHNAVHFSKNIDENNPHSSRERYCNAASNIDMKTLLAGSRNINQLISSKITTNELEPKRRTQRLTMPSLLPAQLQQGPHCDQFLKKIGLCKSETTETYEHYCDMSYLNITCSRWKAYCLKIEAIIKRGLPVCIEVYLGPVTHKILLEQWILQINERAISPTMTLPSLCSAIRSQLYFSQISAWCDLIKKCENSVAESGRVIYGRSNSSAGDLIQTPQTNFASTIPSTQSHPFPKVCASAFQRPRLNIFYRLRPYDSTASFVSKPRIHNFPNVNVTENFSISVCLKSLPRLNGGIPKVGKVANNLTDSLSAQIFTDKKNTCCTISNSNSFNNTAPLDKPPPPTTSNKEQSTKICDKTMFNSTITIEDYINTVSKDKTTNSQNSSDDNNVFLSKTQNYYDFKSESDCSNSLDGLSHREKQLLKYKKRMQKRDKQLRSYFKTSNSCFTQCALPTNQFELDGGNNRNFFQKDSKISNSNLKESTATSTVTKVSIGTQTQQMCCKQCGNEKSLLCLTCENHANNSATTNETETDIEPMTMLSSNKSMANNNEENMTTISKTELLLEGTQRSPQSLRLKKKCSSVDPIFTIKSDVSQQNNNHNSDSSNSIITEKGCRLCKRQKTQHTYVDDDTASVQQQDQDLLDKLEIGKNDYRDYDIAINVPKADSNRMEPIFKTPTEDEQHMKNNVDRVHTINYLTNITEQSNDEFRPNLLVARLKNSSESQEATPPLAMCNKSKIVRKSVPKINLTPIFCKSPQSSINEQYWKSITSPVSIDLKDVVPSSSKTAYQKIESSAKIQKSNSAPTLPNTLTVSPRFPKQFNANKGRSRHISDRSDRSSLCSDEMFSDEECESYAFSPSTSPNKKRYNYFSQNRRLPLLGNLEESLLQKRFIPKMEVVGFKVLLGASGGFCPTQLTIPASSYFYELQSQDISTPYICEIRLPRKGYVVPRSGTVQVTLLNPTGTVVRMFVVPYDMRDMPPLHTTFVRQRILADTNTKSSKNTTTPTTSTKDNRPVGDKDDDKIYFRSSTNTNNQNYEKEFGYFISAEHMKRLRYCIHLKFQTSRSGRLLLHTDIRLLISRRTDCDTAIAHAKGALESSSDLLIQTFMPENPTYSMRQENLTKL